MIVGIITDHGIGGSFLTWSLHYLSSDSEYFYTPLGDWIPLTVDPLTDINAHNCSINHPVFFDEFTDCIQQLVSTLPKTFHSVYIHPLHDFQYITNIGEGYDIKKDAATRSAIHTMQETSKLIVVQLLPTQILYHAKFENRSLSLKCSNASDYNTTFEEQHTEIVNSYFYNDKIAWGDLSNVWDYREFLALNVRPFNVASLIEGIDLSKEHYLLNCFHLFTNLDKIIENLFLFLGLQLDSTRKEHWLNIYRKWQTLHYDRMLFANCFDQIIHCIVNNHDMDLTIVNWDIVREATIQHVLIYKYGLTLKSWGLEKFPNNTQDLYTLLEPNIYHQVDDIYNVLK